MNEVIGNIAGGLGLFVAGMWLLTQNLKSCASRRLRRQAANWTRHPLGAVAWGALAGTTTQSMTALIFIVVGILRSGLVDTRQALALILGGGIGTSTLVLVVTFDVRTMALYVLAGAAGTMVIESLARYRAIAMAVLGATLVLIGLMLIKETAAPLAETPWFHDTLEGARNSLTIALLVSAALSFAVQSASAITVLAISMAETGLISVEQAIMTIYGSFVGAASILCVLATGLTGRSRQVAMYMVIYTMGFCAVMVALLYVEIALDVPLVMAAALALPFGLEQQLAAVCIGPGIMLTPIMVALLGPSARALERLWPTSATDELSRTVYVHDNACADPGTAIELAELEQRRTIGTLSAYFEAIRSNRNLAPVREAIGKLIREVSECLEELQMLHPAHAIEDQNKLRNQQKTLEWLEATTGALCEALARIEAQPLESLRSRVCEGVDAVLMSLAEASRTGDQYEWTLVRQMTGERAEAMRSLRAHYAQRTDTMPCGSLAHVNAVTNLVEEVFVIFTRIEKDFGSREL